MLRVMDHLASRTLLPATVLFLSAVAGCGGGNLPKLADVSGTIQLDGKPLADASVTFIPANGRPSSGTTDSRGYYSMTYSERADGVVPGSCRVMISTGKPGKENEDGESEPATPETVPTEYNLETSLLYDVKLGTANTANFSLTGGGAVAASTTGEEDVPERATGQRQSGE